MAISPIKTRDDDAKAGILKRFARGGVKKLRTIYGNQPSTYESLNNLFVQMAPLAYKLPWEILDYVEILATYNPDYSQAVDIIKSLANSGHELLVEGPSQLASRRMKDRLEEKARTIQESHGGIDGLIEKLLDQAATYGAMCGEWILDESMTGVIDFQDINPKKIRYFWEEDEQKWAPYQRVTLKEAKEAEKQGQKIKQLSYVKLNEITFRYFAFDAEPGSPYGVPPFIAALQPIAMQRDMNEGMAQIVKKIGLLALIDAQIESLKPSPGETQEQFEVRAKAYLDDYAEVIEQGIRDGGIIHFDDAIISATSLAGNAAGATNIWKQNEEQVFSGLKSMPSVHGRSYSTTETYAGVAYDILLRNMFKYQRGCKRMIEVGYWLDLTLGGTPPNSLGIRFKKNKTLQRLQEAQAEQTEIKNSRQLWIDGIINQLQYAQRHGFDEPSTPMDEPREFREESGPTEGTEEDDGGKRDGQTPQTN